MRLSPLPLPALLRAVVALSVAALAAPLSFAQSPTYSAGIDAGTDGRDNVYVGSYAGYKNRNGDPDLSGQNVTVGAEAGGSVNYSMLSRGSVFLGYQSGQNGLPKGADYNVFLGYQSGAEAQGGAQNLFAGARSGVHNKGSYNTFLGGYGTGANNGTGSDNVFVGNHAGRDNVSGRGNTYVGRFAAFNVEGSGHWNVAMGYDAAGDFGDGNGNVSLGYQANEQGAGDYNVSLGYRSGTDNSGATPGIQHNVSIGYLTNKGLTTGSYNTSIGYRAGSNLTEGLENVSVGSDAGFRLAGGDYNVSLGYKAACDLQEGQYNVYIGANAGKGMSNTSGRLYVSSYDGSGDDSSPLLYGEFDNGRLAIGGTSTTDGTDSYALSVYGDVRGGSVKVYDVASWSDFVFESGYELPELGAVSAFIRANGHLPDVPSEEEVLRDGFRLEEMDATLLRKVEELTLYAIQAEEEREEAQSESEALREENAALRQEVDALEARLSAIERLLSEKE